MKRLILTTIIATISYCSFGQNINYGTETFPYSGFNVYHYGLGWYQDASTTSYGPMAYLSAFGGIKFFTTGAPKAVLDYNGNFGIGTMTPQRRLDLSNAGQMTFGDDVVTSSSNGIYWHGGNSYGIYRTSGNWTTNTYQQLRIQFDTGIQLGAGPPGTNTGYDKSYVEIVSGKGLMVSSGNVGIGTTDTKGYLLAVNGSAIATSMTVKLNSNWPDYVFKPNYILPSLTQVKIFIDQNHHLPEMPSNFEVEKDGLNLGEMNKLLTKKVEELTLYLIAEKESNKKTTAAQQREIDELKKQVTLLLKNNKN